MLMEIKAENFLSFRKADIALGMFNVFIGRNASGKSNFVKLLRFIGLLAHQGGDVNKAVRELGYNLAQGKKVSDIAYGRKEKSIAIELHFKLNETDYRYDIIVDAYEGRISSEVLKADDAILVERTDLTKYQYITDKGLSQGSVNVGELALACASSHEDCDKRVRTVQSYLSSWAFYNFNPSVMRDVSSIGLSENLSYDGRNLPQVLHTLLTTKRRVFQKVEELLKMVVPEVEELLTPPIGSNEVKIAAREKGFEEPFDPEQISDGTLRLLAFITALALPNPLVGFEEPENCVHPDLLSSLVELIRVSGKQVIMTTHSPYLLNYVKPEEVYLVAKVKGTTVVRHLASHEEIDVVKKYLELGGSLGEAWISGMIRSE